MVYLNLCKEHVNTAIFKIPVLLLIWRWTFWCNWTRCCVIVYRSYTLLKTVSFFVHPVFLQYCCKTACSCYGFELSSSACYFASSYQMSSKSINRTTHHGGVMMSYYQFFKRAAVSHVGFDLGISRPPMMLIVELVTLVLKLRLDRIDSSWRWKSGRHFKVRGMHIAVIYSLGLETWFGTSRSRGNLRRSRSHLEQKTECLGLGPQRLVYKLIYSLKLVCASVSYTHLTLPTKRIV